MKITFKQTCIILACIIFIPAVALDVVGLVALSFFMFGYGIS